MPRSLVEMALASRDPVQHDLAVLVGDLPIDRLAVESGVNRWTIRRALRGDAKRGLQAATLERITSAVQRMR